MESNLISLKERNDILNFVAFSLSFISAKTEQLTGESKCRKGFSILLDVA